MRYKKRIAIALNAYFLMKQLLILRPHVHGQRLIHGLRLYAPHLYAVTERMSVLLRSVRLSYDTTYRYEEERNCTVDR